MTADPDSLLDTLQLYRKQITWTAVAVAVVVGGGFLWKANSARREAQGEKAFYDAMSLASRNDPKAGDALRKAASRYDGTAGGVQAAIFYAQELFDKGKFTDGQKALDGVKSPGAFASSIESLKAAGYEGEQKFDKAAEHYMAAVAKAELTGQRDYLKGEAARAYANAGKKDEAIKLWKELAEKPDSPMAAEARIRLGELTAVAAKK